MLCWPCFCHKGRSCKTEQFRRSHVYFYFLHCIELKLFFFCCCPDIPSHQSHRVFVLHSDGQHHECRRNCGGEFHQLHVSTASAALSHDCGAQRIRHARPCSTRHLVLAIGCVDPRRSEWLRFLRKWLCSHQEFARCLPAGERLIHCFLLLSSLLHCLLFFSTDGFVERFVYTRVLVGWTLVWVHFWFSIYWHVKLLFV